MKFCESCGHLIGVEALFCPLCRRSITPVKYQYKFSSPSYAVKGTLKLSDALKELESIPNPDKTAQLLAKQYRTILCTEGKYILHLDTELYYLFVEYYVKKDIVYAIIDHNIYAGTFSKNSVVGCNVLYNRVEIAAFGVNSYSRKKQEFTFDFKGNMVIVRGSRGYRSQAFKRVE